VGSCRMRKVCFDSGASKRPPALFPPRSQTTKDTAGGLAPWPRNSLTREGSSGEYWNGRQHRSESPIRIESIQLAVRQRKPTHMSVVFGEADPVEASSR